MKKFMYFLGWLFNVKQWDSSAIRNLGYIIVALGVYFVTDNTAYATITFLLFLMFELLVMGILKNKWDQYHKEQEKVFDELSQK